MPKGILFILSAPSGTGKSTICRKLLQSRKDLEYSVSCTTRSPRPGERQGKHYHFLGREDFKRRIQKNEFLEWAVVHDEYYGTPRAFIEGALRRGSMVLLAIDVQGAAAIRRKIPESVLVFVSPPTLASLRQRLSSRREDSGELEKRLSAAKSELAAAKNYDYFVVNDELEHAVSQIDSIITAEGLKTARREMTTLTPA